MKLVVKNPYGELLDFEVLPEDTFNDLQIRLFRTENLVLNIEKLETPNKPITMSANVMEYFNRKDNEEKPIETTLSDQLKPEHLFPPEAENLQEISPLKINLKDEIGLGEKWDELELSDPIDIVTEHVLEDSGKSPEPEKTPVKENPENIRFPENLLLEPMPRCRLCSHEMFEDDIAYLYEVNTQDGMTVADKINTCLPVVVSLHDKLPKQICSSCLANLESSYIFASQVTSAEEKLIELQLNSKEEHMNCPLCCEGFMDEVPPEELDLGEENSESLEVEVENEDDDYVRKSVLKQNSNLFQVKGKRKRYLESQDLDWSSSSQIEPPKKISRRGRPKGVKNRIAKTKMLSCYICFLKLKHVDEALQHALNAHCDSKTCTYPCPLCQEICGSEAELTNHLDTHFEKREITVIQCCMCDVQIQQTDEMSLHILDKHLKNTDAKYSCTWCQTEPLDSGLLMEHVFNNHVKSGTFVCPICETDLESKAKLCLHFKSAHLDDSTTMFCCPECDLKMESESEQLTHVIEQHCPSVVYKLPLYYSCVVCTNTFRSQYQLSKHTCSSVFDDLSCAKCGKRFPTKQRLVFHIFNHEETTGQMRCDECLALFSDEDNFYDHIRFQHEPDEPTTCEECGKVFKNELGLTTHMRRHQNSRDHQCPECGKKFQNAQTLREHSVGHMTVKPYQCHICGAYLSRLSRLRIHLRFHSVKDSQGTMNVFKCSSCSQVFPNMNLAVKHFQNLHDEIKDINLEECEINMVFRCEFCDACFIKMTELNSHRKSKHPDPYATNAYTCSVCRATFSTYARVTTHKLSHGINTESLILSNDGGGGDKEADTFTIPQYFLCNECDKKSLHYTYLNLHRRFQHLSGKPVFPCYTCNDKFPTSWALQFHIKKQHGNESLEKLPPVTETLVYCPHCEKPYKTETSLENHVKRCHSSSENQDVNSYICETCGKTFLYQSALEAHIDAHKGQKRFECPECKKRFTHRAGLLRHMKLHADDGAYKCEFCNKKFRDRTERDNHCRAHTGERPFMCDVCGRFFHTRAVLLDHSRIHTDIRPFQCDVCSQTFRRSYALKNHYLIHTGVKPYSCNHCNKTFRLRQTLTAHIKKEHIGGVSSLPPDQVLIEEDSLLVDSVVDSKQEEEVNLMIVPGSVKSEVENWNWKKDDLSCSECGETFLLKMTLQAHMRKNHPHLSSKREMKDDSLSNTVTVSGNSFNTKAVLKPSTTFTTVPRRVYAPKKVKDGVVASSATQVQPGSSLLLR